jgi:hypothetical protein
VDLVLLHLAPSTTAAASSLVVPATSSAMQDRALYLNHGCFLSQLIQQHGNYLNILFCY